MNRRKFLWFLFASSGTTELQTGRAISSIEIEPTDSTVAPPEGVEPADWFPHYEVDIEKNGQAVIRLTAKGDEVPRILRLEDRKVTGEEFLKGANAISDVDNGYNWEPSKANPIEYSVKLGEVGKAGYFSTAVLEEAVVSVIPEYLPVADWIGGGDALPKRHRVTVNQPGDWTSIAPGTRVGTDTYDLYPNINQKNAPKDGLIVGNLSVNTRSVGGSEIRFVELPSTQGPDREALVDTLANARTILEDYYGLKKQSPVLAVIAPSEVEPSEGTRQGDMIVLENGVFQSDPLSGKTAILGEQTHTFQRFHEPEWQKEGQTTWFKTLLLFDMGEISESKVQEILENEVSVDDLTKPAADSVYDKGRVVVGALDLDIRARTNNNSDLGDFLARANETRLMPTERITRSRQLTALSDITGVDYTDFYRRFVDGSEYPETLLSPFFSIEEPMTTWGNIEVKNAKVAKKEVLEGEPLSFSVDVENTGKQWAKRVIGIEYQNLETLSGSLKQAGVVELDPGESRTVSFDVLLPKSADYEIEVAGQVFGPVTVVARAPAFSLQDYELSTEELLVGEPLELTAEVENSGTAAGEIPIELSVNEEVTNESRVDLGIDETRTLEFEQRFSEAGTYKLEINNVPLGTVSVEPKPTTSPTSTPSPTESPGQPGFGFIAAIAGVGSMVGYLLSRGDAGDD